MDEKPSIKLTDGGLWNTRRPQHNTETTRLIKTLVNEARINNFQHSQLTNNMLRGSSLSTNSETLSKKPARPKKTLPNTGLRTYNDIVNSGAYNQPEYHPKPMKVRTEEEKDRLANLMAYGTDPRKMPFKITKEETPREIDRFDELVLEIEQRKNFLDQMTALGKRKEYHEIISNEIADKIREMEQIDRQRSKLLEKHLKEFHQ